MNKRKLLKGIGAGSLWATPSIATILTPMHAQATPMPQQCPIIQDFTTPGEFTVTVPSCATRMIVQVAGGSSGRAINAGAAGLGSLVNATINVTAGETLNVIVASQGLDGNSVSPSPVDTGATVGYGRGGNGGVQERLGLQVGGFRYAAGGGGGSAILRGSEPLVVAGGGGGGWINQDGSSGDTDAAVGGATAGSNGIGGQGGISDKSRPGFENAPDGEMGGSRDGANGSPGLIIPPFAISPGGGGGGGFGGGGSGGGDQLQGQQGGGGGSMFTGTGNIVPGGAPLGSGSISITFE